MLFARWVTAAQAAASHHTQANGLVTFMRTFLERHKDGQGDCKPANGAKGREQQTQTDEAPVFVQMPGMVEELKVKSVDKVLDTQGLVAMFGQGVGQAVEVCCSGTVDMFSI